MTPLHIHREASEMATVTLTPSDLQRLKADPRFSAAHAALLEIMIAQGEVIIEPATVPHTSQALEP